MKYCDSLSRHVCAVDCRGSGGGVMEADAYKLKLLTSDRLLPSHHAGTIARLDSRLYCGRFSRDGSTFAVSRQDDRWLRACLLTAPFAL